MDCFKTVLKILQGDVFRENVGQSFKNTYAWIEESFSYRIKDLENFDYAVVVAGNVLFAQIKKKIRANYIIFAHPQKQTFTIIKFKFF